MIVTWIIWMIYGLILVFFWACAFSLAKDRARKGMSLIEASVFSVVFILGLTLLVAALFIVLLGFSADSKGILNAFIDLYQVIGKLLIYDWLLPMGVFGMSMSAWLGGYFGILQYHEESSDKAE